jgi:hypothetical protein
MTVAAGIDLRPDIKTNRAVTVMDRIPARSIYGH